MQPALLVLGFLESRTEREREEAGLNPDGGENSLKHDGKILHLLCLCKNVEGMEMLIQDFLSAEILADAVFTTRI